MMRLIWVFLAPPLIIFLFVSYASACSVSQDYDLRKLEDVLMDIPAPESSADPSQSIRDTICVLQQAITKKTKLLGQSDVDGVLGPRTRRVFADIARCTDVSPNFQPEELDGSSIFAYSEIFLSTIANNLNRCKFDYSKNLAAKEQKDPAKNTIAVASNSGTKSSNSCLPFAQISDPDIKRNKKVLASTPQICITQHSFSEHGVKWKYLVLSNTKRKSGPTLAVLHDNENAAFDTALYSVIKYGGKMIAVEAAEKRLFISGQDPNRNFGETSNGTRSCRGMIKRPAPIFTREIKKHFGKKYPIITLHNNANGYSGAGGSGSISAKRNSSIMTGHMSTKPKGKLSDEDNSIITAGKVPFSTFAKKSKLLRYMNNKGINIIYEAINASVNDCSFSNYAVLVLKKPYFNIEAQAGHLKSQKIILDELMKFIGVKQIR